MRILLVSLFVAFCLGGKIYAEDVYAVFNVKAIKDANLAIDVSGVVEKIFVDVDSEVKKGAQLLILDNKDKAAQLESIKQQYLFAKAQWERYAKSADAVDKNTLDQQKSNFKKLEADYQYYQSMYNKSVLRAPFDGVIAEKKIEVGDGVGGTSTALFRLVSAEKKLVLQFDSKHLDKVKVGDSFEYSIDGTNSKGSKQSVTINKIYPTIDKSTRKATAEASAPSSLKPGLFGDGFIKTTKINAQHLPSMQNPQNPQEKQQILQNPQNPQNIQNPQIPQNKAQTNGNPPSKNAPNNGIQR